MRAVHSIMALFLCAAPQAACHAAILKPFGQIVGPTIRLADLFDELGTTPDRVLGASPAPGARIVVGSPQLAAIARDFNVDWRPSTGNEQAVIERHGETLPRAVIDAALRRSLADAGAPADADVVAPDIQPILVPARAGISPEISQLSFDAQSGHFSAMLTVSSPDMTEMQTRVSGQVVSMTETVVAARRLVPGAIVEDGDLQQARVRTANLRGAAGVTLEAARGLSVKHALSAGQPVSVADLVRPPLVLRGAAVRMTLDSEGIALSAQGIATEAGARGDRIRVENPVSHLLVDAEVTGPGEVRVAPREAVVTLVSAR